MLDLTLKNLLYIRELPQQRQEVAVNRTELVDSVASKAGLDKKNAEAAVSAVTASRRWSRSAALARASS